MSSERAWRTHPPHDPRLDDGAAGAVVEKPRRGKARRATTPERAAALRAASREPAGLLRGLQRLRQERFCPRRACRADAARTDAKIVVSGHVGLIGCRKLSGENAFPNIARCARYGAMFGAWLKLLPSSPQPTARTRQTRAALLLSASCAKDRRCVTETPRGSAYESSVAPFRVRTSERMRNLQRSPPSVLFRCDPGYSRIALPACSTRSRRSWRKRPRSKRPLREYCGLWASVWDGTWARSGAWPGRPRRCAVSSFGIKRR